MLWGGGSNNSMCFNSFLGQMMGNPLMTNISTLLVFVIPWHHRGSGVVSQNCCRTIDDVTAVGLNRCRQDGNHLASFRMKIDTLIKLLELRAYFKRSI